MFSFVPAADILDVVRESVQKYKAFYIGSLPVSKSMGRYFLMTSATYVYNCFINIVRYNLVYFISLFIAMKLYVAVGGLCQ